MSDSAIKVQTEAEKEALLEISGLKKPLKGPYMVLYYLMIGLSLSVTGIGTSAAMASGFAGKLNFSLGAFYFGAAVILLCLALYFRFRAKAR